MTIEINRIPKEVIETLKQSLEKDLNEIQKKVDFMFTNLTEKGYIHEIDIDVTIRQLKEMLPNCQFLQQIGSSIQEKLEEPDPDDLF